MADLPMRRPIRLRGFDYREPGAYFITVCTYRRECVFGQIRNDDMVLNPLGAAVAEAWQGIPEHFPVVQTDAFVVMPNHVHGILIMKYRVGAKHASPLHQRPRGTLSGSMPAVMQSFKAAATRAARQMRGIAGKALWQRGFYDHVIRNEPELNRIRAYIEQNPLRWALDEENPYEISLRP